MWLGPATQSEIQNEFDSIFPQDHAHIPAADDYLLSSWEEEIDTRKALAKIQGMYSRDDVAPSIRNCFAHREWKRGEQYGKEFLLQKSEGDASWVSDISQSPDVWSRVSSQIPSCTGGSRLLSYSKGALFTPRDLDIAYGWPDHAVRGRSEFLDCVPERRKCLPYAQKVQAKGQGFHLENTVKVILYIATRVAKRENPSMCSVSSIHVESSDDEEK